MHLGQGGTFIQQALRATATRFLLLPLPAQGGQVTLGKHSLAAPHAAQSRCSGREPLSPPFHLGQNSARLRLTRLPSTSPTVPWPCSSWMRHWGEPGVPFTCRDYLRQSPAFAT